MEIEAKWVPARPLTVDDVEQCDWAPFALGARRQLRQTNRYFDSPDGALRRQHFSLRLRKENDRLIVTLKGQNEAGRGIHRRVEEEAECVSDDPVTWPPEIMDRVRAIIDIQALAPYLLIENERQAWPVLRAGTQIGELALDSGTIFAGPARAPLHELEWELKGGSEADFQLVCAMIGRMFPVTPSDTTKLERGLALLRATPAS